MCVLRFLETFEEEEVVNEVAAELKEVEERIKKEQTDAKKSDLIFSYFYEHFIQLG